MVAKKRSSKQVWRDPDDAPVLTKQWFDEADIVKGRKIIRRGRPAGTATKQAISIRIDKDILAHFREAGAGWQVRINAALRHAMGSRKLARMDRSEREVKKTLRRRPSTFT